MQHRRSPRISAAIVMPGRCRRTGVSPLRYLSLLYIGAILLVVLISPHVLKAQDEAEEYELKVAFLLNFARFSAWNPESPRAEEPVFSICVWRKNPFGDLLNKLAEKRVHARPVSPRVVMEVSQISSCDLLYLSGQEAKEFQVVLTGAQRFRVLTVTEGIPDGGAIQLMLSDRQLRFECNLVEAAKIGVIFSSELLKLARRVVGE